MNFKQRDKDESILRKQ